LRVPNWDRFHTDLRANFGRFELGKVSFPNRVLDACPTPVGGRREILALPRGGPKERVARRAAAAPARLGAALVGTAPLRSPKGGASSARIASEDYPSAVSVFPNKIA